MISLAYIFTMEKKPYSRLFLAVHFIFVNRFSFFVKLLKTFGMPKDDRGISDKGDMQEWCTESTAPICSFRVLKTLFVNTNCFAFV